jgi:Ser/Thr protein kinase RdoA (MazF antagonist)
MNLPDAEAANGVLQPGALAGVARAWGIETVSPLRRLGGYSSLNLLVSADQRPLVLKRTAEAQEAPLARVDTFVRDLPAASLPPPGRIPTRDGARSWRRPRCAAEIAAEA